MSIQNRIASDVYKLAASATTPQQMQALQQHLSQSIQSGALPGYIGIPVVQDLTQRMHHAQTAQASQQPQQPPIAQQVMQQAQAEAPGVDQLQSNLPTHMAAGGIIAFEHGGEVPRFDGAHGSSEVSGAFTVATNPEDLAIQQQIAQQFEQVKADYNLGRMSKQAYMDKASELNNRLKFSLGNTAQQAQAPAVSSDPFFAAQEASFLAPSTLRKIGKAGLDYTALLPYTVGKAAYHGLQNLHDQNTMTIDPVTKQPISVANLRDQPITQAAHDVAFQYKTDPSSLGSMPIGNMADAMRTGEVNPLAALATRGNSSENTTAPAGNPTPPGAPAGDKYTNPMAGADKLFTRPKDIKAQQLSDMSGEYQALLDANPGMTAEQAMARRQEMLGADTGREEIRQKLKDMEARTNKEDERSPWMALMKAGLSTMAGTSPYALANIGKGGMEGLSDYAAAQERVDKAREKQLDINQRIAQADRAEKVAAVDYGLNSEERDKARAEKIRLDKLATKVHVQGINAQNDLSAQEHTVTNQMNYAKNVADARYQQGMIDVHHETNQIQRETKALTKEQSAATNMLKISMQPIMAKLKASGMADEDAYDAALYQALSQMPEDKVALLGYNPASVKNLATPRAKGSAVLKDGVYYYQPAK